jgi:hypothetical protein
LNGLGEEAKSTFTPFLICRKIALSAPARRHHTSRAETALAEKALAGAA